MNNTPNKQAELKMKLWNIYRFNPKNKTSTFLGVVRAKGNPHAIGRAWTKFKVPRTNQELSKIYARLK